ncbi:fibronectin type III domain-containing protein [Nocardia otitidiscaviarum]|uniref:fibronectin type III domain-containing protein n=1 Tax=Nocardia otitidiscaviarum TaxID=1823 RepID=UPI000693B23D|nr:fibronectin type III domain-containing protein [Nocardia otitidiscaviarum]MBF6132617.1 fibronectin type III domain-containing protein [Nocardia otitidiscaviarum]MBF6488718.1 fibronectin type III domain-containing protein [Nocardia otitidiscaviarum]
MQPFSPNDYRKRVLAAVERRGGLEHSDAFELYDIPLDEATTLTDSEVEARIEEVWGFWQKQRDHPKYRVLVGLLVDGHEELSYPLLSAASRRVEADRVRQLRARREGERYEMLDTAIERMVNRHGGIPAAKLPGLEDIGKLSGLDADEIAARLRRHRILDETPTAAAPPTTEVTVQRRQQIRQLLTEYERLLPGDPVPTLLVLLGLDYARAHETAEIRLRAEALRARTRELPPGRVRVVLDELLVHVQDLLEPGGHTVDDYLRAIAADVADQLRPQVRAAILVEDQLVEADYDFLVHEAIAGGLDHSTAQQVVIGLATELGSTVEGVTGAPDARGTSAAGIGPGGAAHDGSRRGPEPDGSAHGSAHTTEAPDGAARDASGHGSDHRGSTSAGGYGTTSASPHPRAWEEPLKAARAALRAGHPRKAAHHVERARRAVDADGTGMTSVRPVAEEVDRVLSEAVVRWRSATAGCAGKRYVEALDHLQYLERHASDVPDPQGGRDLSQLLAEARAAIAEADRLLAAAPTGPLDTRMRAMRAVLDLCADHTGARAALAAVPIDPPGVLTAIRQPNGTVTLTWEPSPTADVEYRVTRLQPDDSWRVVGRTRATELEDGGAPDGPLPIYGVVATLSGRTSDMSRTDAPSTPPPTPAPTPPTPGRIDITRPDRRAARAAARANASEGAGAAAAASTAAGSGTSGAGGAAIPAAATDTSTGAASPLAPGGAGAAAAATGAGAADPSGGARASTGSSAHPGAAPPTDPAPSGIPVVENLAIRGDVLTFDWPLGVTEVMVVVRTDSPPVAPDDPDARAWKLTNTRYQIDGGGRLPVDIPRPCHIAIASTRREPNGMLTVAAGFASSARIRWEA